MDRVWDVLLILPAVHEVCLFMCSFTNILCNVLSTVYKISIVDALHAEISADYYCGGPGPDPPCPNLSGRGPCRGSAREFSHGNRTGPSGLMRPQTQRVRRCQAHVADTCLGFLTPRGPPTFLKGPQEGAAPLSYLISWGTFGPRLLGMWDPSESDSEMDLGCYSCPPSNWISPGCLALSIY